MEYNCLIGGEDEASNLEANGLKTHIGAMELKGMTGWVLKDCEVVQNSIQFKSEHDWIASMLAVACDSACDR